MHQQLWGYKVEEKLYLGVHEQKGLNTTGLECIQHRIQWVSDNPFPGVMLLECEAKLDKVKSVHVCTYICIRCLHVVYRSHIL
jgi:hypothetical protein